MTDAPGSLVVRPEIPAAPPRQRRVPRAWLAGAIVVAVAAGVLVAAAAFTAAGHGGVRLEVWDTEGQRVVYSRAARVGETFDLEHVHSVHRRPVIETFSVQDERTLALEEIRFDVSGANLPSGPERIGDEHTTFVTEGGSHRVIHNGRAIGSLPLRVGGPDIDHTLIFDDGERVRLLAVARRGAPVELRVSHD